MVYSVRVFESIEEAKEAGLLSSKEAMDILGVTKVTLYKWIMLKKIKVRRFKIGARVYNGFDKEEMLKLKAKMVKKWEPGKPLIRG